MPAVVGALSYPVLHTRRIFRVRASKGFQTDGTSEAKMRPKGNNKDGSQKVSYSAYFLLLLPLLVV